MHLRNHPKLRDHWPPPWGTAYAPGDKFLIGEQGTLKTVVLQSDRVVLTAEYEGNTHTGALPSDDPTFLERLYERLNQSLGHSLSEVGDLEIDF